jgi:FkbM family methyltransferase
MSLLWHPQQKLWNWRLVGRLQRALRPVPGAGAVATRAIIAADTGLLWGRVLLRRLASRPLRPLDVDRTVLYIDAGLFRDGRELEVAASWLRRYRTRLVGFEAGSAQFASAVRRLRHLDAEIVHAALVGPDHQGQTVTLHHRDHGGIDDSLLAAHGTTVEDVPAVRLSDIIRGANEDVLILRMNIEGAEELVIADLAVAGLLQRISGFYGMWDDLSKIDEHRSRRFRERLGELNIEPITFNGRDLRHRIRLAAIHYDIETTIRAQRTDQARQDPRRQPLMRGA